MTRFDTLLRRLVLISAVSLVWALPAMGQATEPTPAEVQREQERVDRLWNRAWRDFAPYYVKHGSKYVCVPTYDRQHPNSSAQTARDYLKENTRDQKVTDDRGREQTRTLVKPQAEARAAVELLPEAAVGQYGTIHSGDIDRIIDDKTVALENIWLLDAEAVREEKAALKDEARKKLFDEIEDAIRDGARGRRGTREGIMRRLAEENESIDWSFKERETVIDRQRKRAFRDYEWQIIGYRTERLTENERWPTGKAAEKGLQVVVIAVEAGTITAVPTASIGKDISEQDFLDLIWTRGYSKADFVELVTEAKREHRSDYKPVVLSKLEKIAVPNADDDDEPANDTVELAD